MVLLGLFFNTKGTKIFHKEHKGLIINVFFACELCVCFVSFVVNHLLLGSNAVIY